MTSPSGEGSPLARLYELDAHVLLLGVGHANNSSMHLAEERADWPLKKSCDHSAPLILRGKRQWVTFEALDYDSDDFDLAGESFDAQVAGKVGQAEARLFLQRDVVDHAVAWIQANRK